MAHVLSYAENEGFRDQTFGRIALQALLTDSDKTKVKQKTKQIKQIVDHHTSPEPDIVGVFAAIIFGFILLIRWLGFGRRRFFRRPRRYWRGSPGVFRKMRPLWKSYNPDGYVLTANGQLEHREIAERILGRRLEGREDVHHMNGVRHDNRPENLCVMDHRDHMRYHEWYDWVREKGKFPRRVTQLRKLREDFNGTILSDFMNKKSG